MSTAATIASAIKLGCAPDLGVIVIQILVHHTILLLMLTIMNLAMKVSLASWIIASQPPYSIHEHTCGMKQETVYLSGLAEGGAAMSTSKLHFNHN